MPDGTIMHAEIQIDDSIIMLGDSFDKFPPVAMIVDVYVLNVDEVFERAIDAGCEIVESQRSEKVILIDERPSKILQEICGQSDHNCKKLNE